MSAPAARAAAPTAALRSSVVPLAWGAGLIVIGLGAATTTDGSSSAPARAIGLAISAAGLAWLAWGAAALSVGRLVLSRTAAASTLVTVAGVAALVVATGGRASVVGAAIAVALLTVVAVMIVAERRRHGAPSPVRLLPLALAAAIVAVVATPALGAVQEAALRQPDGSVIVIDPHAGH